jgi:acrylyl-CoA reductase (NADPH)
MARFKALLLSKTDEGQRLERTELDEGELMDGDVTIRVACSTINFKDALALTGKGPIVRRWPMIPGIDFAGTVERSDDPRFKAGDGVLGTGWGMSELHYGGYAEKARVPADWLVPLPAGLAMGEAMAIGTAGLTAMLAVLALERHGVVPGRGPVAVTGASGGVGSVAIALLAGLGFEVAAVTGKAAEADYLRELGATEIVDRATLAGPARPLASERWAGAVDSVGSHPLAHLIAATRRHGAVAACGNAAGLDLPGSVAPFILRGVALLGIDSNYAEPALRRTAWERLARDLDRAKLAAMTRRIAFDDLLPAAEAMMAGQARGRVVVDIGA